MLRTAMPFLSGVLLAAALLIALSPGNGLAEEDDGATRARETWNNTCQKCHTVPDATFETGRAFLAQITGTS